MIKTIYIEEEIAEHHRVNAILNRFPKADVIPCDRYSHVFNNSSQNFRIQKTQPSLILARKNNRRVLNTPESYGIGGQHNYYFSHMLNCLYDCRYCFLQGMYRSAHYVVFVNYEDFLSDIETSAKQHSEPSWYFSGYDCDSLAMEPVTGFMQYALDNFASLNNAYLEIRTKSTQINALLKRQALNNVVVAFSFTPQQTAERLEHKVPSVAKRIAAAKKLQLAGWKIGIRLDPLISTENFDSDYRKLLDQIFSELDGNLIHSVSYGAFRLPREFFKRMIKLYPREALFAANLTEHNLVVSYPPTQETRNRNIIEKELAKFVDSSRIYPCDI